MATIGSLNEHLQQWDPPEDVQVLLRKFALYEQNAVFKKWEDQQVYKCEDKGLYAAVAPLIQMLQLERDVGYNVWRMSGTSILRNSSNSAYLIPVRSSPGATVSQKPLAFGQVTYIDKNVEVNGDLDCLVILL